MQKREDIKYLFQRCSHLFAVESAEKCICTLKCESFYFILSLIALIES